MDQSLFSSGAMATSDTLQTHAGSATGKRSDSSQGNDSKYKAVHKVPQKIPSCLLIF
jgi:hypothetical protein